MKAVSHMEQPTNLLVTCLIAKIEDSCEELPVSADGGALDSQLLPLRSEQQRPNLSRRLDGYPLWPTPPGLGLSNCRLATW